MENIAKFSRKKAKVVKLTLGKKKSKSSQLCFLVSVQRKKTLKFCMLVKMKKEILGYKDKVYFFSSNYSN